MPKPTLYIIVNREHLGVHGVLLSLQAACERQGIPYEFLVAEDIALDAVHNMRFAPGSLLYRVSTRLKAATLESMLVLLHPGVFTTIYWPKTAPLSSRPFRELCEQMAAGLPIVPTLIIDETWQQADSASLQAKADSLGGFPVIVKVLGLSHGVGVQKVDDMQALQTVLAGANFAEHGMVARKYLASYRHFRLIIVDDAVVAAIEYHQPADDFRTNASEEPMVSALALDELEPAISHMAVAGVQLRSSILGGVDILVDQTDNTPYLAEVNVPCYFARAEGPTGIDIAGQLITTMLQKREKEVQK
jgi:hypothetical protein